MARSKAVSGDVTTDGMSFDEASAKAQSYGLVRRASWGPDKGNLYGTSSSDGPYLRQQTLNQNGQVLDSVPYEPTAEDLEATDWEAVAR